MIREDLGYQIANSVSYFHNSKPFNHLIIDNFFKEEIANKIIEEFPKYNSNAWYIYDNPIENKKTCNDWNKFGEVTYSVFNYLNSQHFLNHMNFLVGDTLYSDPGLHGGGWHMHGRGGKLNIHLDYDIHPKLGLQRKLNLIVYMTPDWNPEWGGGLEFWDHDEETNSPKSCVKVIENKFNRAILFDTTQNSWHGLPAELNCPVGTYRRSLATYYLHTPNTDATDRKKALFAPYKDQNKDITVLELIKQRVDSKEYVKAYRNEPPFLTAPRWEHET